MCFLNMMSSGDLNRALIIRSNHMLANIAITLKLKIRCNATSKKKLWLGESWLFHHRNLIQLQLETISVSRPLNCYSMTSSQINKNG